MEKRHVGSLYRRSGTATEDSRGRITKPWTLLASGVPVDFQPGSGRVQPGPGGQNVTLAGMLFVHPGDLPSGVRCAADDAWVLTSGPISQSTLLVHAARLQGDATGTWDDELVVAKTNETIP